MPDIFGRNVISRPSRLAYKRRRRYFIYSLLAISSAFSLIMLLGYISSRPSNLFSSLVIEGNRIVYADDINDAVQSATKGSYAGIFRKKNILLYPADEIRRKILNLFPAIESVEVKREKSVLRIIVSERKVDSLWCEGNSDSIDADKCLFIDSDGLVFASAPGFSHVIHRVFFGSASTTVPAVGETVLPSGKYSELLYFIDSMKKIGLDVRSITLDAQQSDNLDYVLRLDNGKDIKVNANRSLQETLNDMTAFFSDTELKPLSNEFMDGISYIDFRFANKVYYK